ncbi:alpha/beta hydrolase family protein [Mycolicibacterium fluoranthenivorans]|uniref:Alpha/beta hydrolase family protein n=1 Tax=Mycolicibacterium fluoranthenivorans TaxID=258505 RepID=A0A1G4VZ23_9MYCO|nr:alpha/beta fold hydrolase [Mycolicibacterium fluoranthenivorans]SCX13427.1 Alpha/beta hydrolase family protein [Mycolicibacterium fluoranthenivorans]
MEPVLFPDDTSFWFETLRVLGAAAYGGADIGEVLVTAQAITAGDYDSWYDQWLATADRIAAEAEKAQAAGHLVSARDGLLRASNYYRSADFYLHGNPDDPRIRHAYGRARDCFVSAAALFDPPVTPVQIPYEGTVLRGYFYPAIGRGGDTEPRPTIVMHSGFDGTCEEMHFLGAAAAQERGYHVFTFDGPGQPAALHFDGLVFRPDWEHVVTPVLDWVRDQPGVDPGKVALFGASMGGLLAPRAAAFEQRLAACIAFDGVYDMGLTALTWMPGSRADIQAVLRAESAPEVDAMIEQLMAANPNIRWAATHGQYAMGVHSPRAFFASMLDYTLADGIAEQITCPTLVCEAAADIFFEGQPQLLFDHLTCPKQLLEFTEAEGAGAHCQVGAGRLAFARIYDWLDDIMAVR